MHNLFAPLIAERVTTAQGAREVAIVAGISDDLFGIDVASGELIWKKHFDSTFAPTGERVDDTLCPGGQTAVPAMAQASAGQVHDLRDVVGRAAAPDQSGRRSGRRAAREVHAAQRQAVRAEPRRTASIYTATAQGCGGVPNAFYSFDLATRKASIFIPAGGGMWGRRGAAVSPEGVVYMGTGDAHFSPQTESLGNAIVGAKLDANQQLQLVDYFAPPNANWMRRARPRHERHADGVRLPRTKFLVGTSKECRVWLLDREALGGEDHRTTLHTTPLLCNDDQAFDAKGVWGAHGRLAGFARRAVGARAVLGTGQPHLPRADRVRPAEDGRRRGVQAGGDSPGKWRLTPAWLSRDMDMAEEVVVANGVVFAYGSGEDTTQTLPDLAWNEPNGPGSAAASDPYSERRIPDSRHATLYALDGADRQGAVVERERRSRRGTISAV